MDHPQKSRHNPEYVGPGVWDAGHMMAAQAKTAEQRKAVLFYIETLSKHFGCQKCQQHFKSFLEKDSPYRYINEPEGLFAWFYRAHNNANFITGKPSLSYDEVRDLYYSKEAVCTAGCGEGKNLIDSQRSQNLIDSQRSQNLIDSQRSQNLIDSQRSKNDLPVIHPVSSSHPRPQSYFGFQFRPAAGDY